MYDIRNEAFHINKRAVNYCIF